MDNSDGAQLDSTDLGLLGRLQRDGRATWKDLGAEFGLSSPAIAARVRRLVTRGVIRQFAALVAPERVGAITAFAQINLDDPDTSDRFRQAIGRLVAVQACHRVAGEAQYMLKLRVRSLEELDTLLARVLPGAAPCSEIRVSMVLSTVKESPVFPLPK